MKKPGNHLDGLEDETLATDNLNMCVKNSGDKIGIDDMLQKWTGEFGRWQLNHFVLCSLALTLQAFHTMVMIFADHQPTWHCNKGKGPDDFFSTKRGFESCSPMGSICSMDREAWDWHGGPAVSTVSEWGLFCDRKNKVGLVQSAFFVGCMLGAALFGRLSDSWLGRKGVLRLVCFGNAIFGLLTALSPNFWVYLILRVLTAITSGGVGLSSFVLATEPVGPSRRGSVGLLTFYFFSFGIAVLPVLSYFSGSWRHLYVVTSIPSVLYCLFVLPFLTESPRWYLMKGRLEDAMGVMRSIAAKNGKLIPVGISLALDSDQDDGTESGELSGNLADVFKSPVMRTRMIQMALIWLACAMIYYGLSLNVGNLGSSLYLSVFLNGIAEVAAYALTAAMLDKFGRRAMLISLMLLSGLSCLLGSLTSVFVQVHGSNPMLMQNRVVGSTGGFLSGVKLLCNVVGIFSAAAMYNLIYVYTSELFPTVLRNAALGLASEAGQIGAIIAPLVVVMATVSPSFPFAIIGVSAIVGSVLAFKLPETLNRSSLRNHGSLPKHEISLLGL